MLSLFTYRVHRMELGVPDPAMIPFVGAGENWFNFVTNVTNVAELRLYPQCIAFPFVFSRRKINGIRYLL